jgi:hypothetical protein
MDGIGSAERENREEIDGMIKKILKKIPNSDNLERFRLTESAE